MMRLDSVSCHPQGGVKRYLRCPLEQLNRVTVLRPVSHIRVPYFFHTISPCHSSSHCRFGRSGQGGSSFCADFPMSFSRRFLSMRRCLVACANDMPRRGFGSSCLHVLNPSRWSHMAIRSQTLSIVSSHERASLHQSVPLWRCTASPSWLYPGRPSSFDTPHPLISCIVQYAHAGSERGLPASWGIPYPPCSWVWSRGDLLYSRSAAMLF